MTHKFCHLVFSLYIHTYVYVYICVWFIHMYMCIYLCMILCVFLFQMVSAKQLKVSYRHEDLPLKIRVCFHLSTLFCHIKIHHHSVLSLNKWSICKFPDCSPNDVYKFHLFVFYLGSHQESICLTTLHTRLSRILDVSWAHHRLKELSKTHVPQCSYYIDLLNLVMA